MNYLLGISDKVRDKDPLIRFDPVQSCTTLMAIQSFKECHFETHDNCCYKITQPTTDTCPIYHGGSAHKLGAYLQEFDSLSPSDDRSTDDKLSYGSDASPRKRAAAPRNER
jgi:hypothetical protein